MQKRECLSEVSYVCKEIFQNKRVMRVVVRCIYYKAVTPSCDIIDMDTETWRSFLHSGGNKRKEIALTCNNQDKEHP